MRVEATKMEAVFLGALLNPLLPFILGVLRDRYNLRQGIQKNITFIKDELPMIAAAIEQHQSVDVRSEEVRRQLIEQLREIAHEMEVCIGLFVRMRARKRIYELRKLRLRYRAWREPLKSRTQFARTLQELRERLVEAKNRAEENTDTAPPSAPMGAQEPEEPELRLLSSSIGMDDPLDHVLGLLQPPWHATAEQEGLKVISIVGPAGVGKTLLARRAYNCITDRVPQFSPHVCVRVADRADQDVCSDILSNIGQHLEGERYLIVIDDLRSRQQWEYIKPCIPDYPRVCSRIVVTTTSLSLAHACSSPSGCVYKMRNLNDSDSVSLFIREACLEEHPDAVQHASAGLRRKCDGLPLALVSIAQFVREKGGLDSCRDICTELGSYLERERTLARMKLALESNYTTLPSSALKACLLYFSTFDSAKPVTRDSTMRRWIAEGFVEQYPRRNCTLLDDAYNNWETLIDKSIIKPTDVSFDGKVERCQPSGMVFEYCSYKSMVQKFVAFPDQIPPPEHTRWLSLHHCRGHFRNLGESRPRTLIVSGTAGEALLRFTNSELLRVLDLEQCTDLEDRHLEKICDLLLLRYLSLGAHISLVPREIENLEWLQTLDLRNTRVSIVPKEVILLPQLTHLLGRFQLLEGDYKRSQKKLKKFLQQESMLETLAGFITGTNQGFPQLIHLMRRLRTVKIIFNSDANPTNMNDLTTAIGQFLHGGTGTGITSGNDRSLSIDFNECSTDFLSSACFQNFMDSLPNAHASLGSLNLSGLGEQLNRAIPFLRNLGGITELCLSSSTLSWDTIVRDGLINLHVLRYLKLVADEIKGDAVSICPEQLRSLKRMCLLVERRLPKITIEDGALEYLVSLHLICKTLDGLSGITITLLKRLKEVALHPQVTAETKCLWNETARLHPNRPNVFFIDSPCRTKEIGQPSHLYQASSTIARNVPQIGSNAPLLPRITSQIAATT